MKITLRNKVAGLLRTLPNFKGKARLGLTLEKYLFRSNADEDLTVTFTMRDGSKMKIDLRSRTEHWTFYTGVYEAKIVRLITNALQPGWRVFDVGANVGFWTIPMGIRLQKIGGHLHAFEPIPANYNRVKEIVALNNLQDTVTYHELALGKENSLVTLRLEDKEGAKTGNAVIVNDKTTYAQLGNIVTAQVVALDDFATAQNLGGCDFMKVDIEGAELLFLEGGQNYIQQQRPIIYAEFNSFSMKQHNQNFLDVVDFIKDWQYDIYKQLNRETDKFIKLTKPEPDTEDVLLVPRETSPSILEHFNVVN